ncbi:MAG: transcriptional repressor [Planctomycetota bacterium]
MSRTTQQRTAIRTAIEASDGPLTPQEVLAAATRTVPGLGIATVYRALSAGVDEGWLQTVHLPTGPARYELAELGHHHHFRCTACDRVFDLEGCPGNLKDLLPPGFELEHHDITLHGKCADCAS